MASKKKKGPSKGALAAKNVARSGYRLDGFQNLVTGFGTSADKTTYGKYVAPIILRDQILAGIYHSHDLAARIVDIVPNEAMREAWELDLGDPEVSSEVDEKLEALRTRERFSDGWRYGRNFGGAGTIIGCEDGRPPSMPLDASRAEDIQYLWTIDKRYLTPLRYYEDPTSGKLGEPETYMLTSPGRGVSQMIGEIHESRLILWPGATTAITEKQSNSGWDYSVLQRIFEVLRSFDEVWHSVELMSVEASQVVFKMSGLLDLMSSDNPVGDGKTGRELIESRMQMVNFYRSVMRALVVSAGEKDVPAEEFERVAVEFSGVADILDKMINRLCAAAHMPATILFGMSPGGMNATGESDIRWFYDRIRSDQVNILAPRLRRLVKLFLQTRAGQAFAKQIPKDDEPELDEEEVEEEDEPEDEESTELKTDDEAEIELTKPEPEKKPAKDAEIKVKVKFKPLWSETPKDAAATRAQLAAGDKIYIDTKVLFPEEVGLSRFRPDGFSQEIQLDDASRKAREKSLKEELTKPKPEPIPLGGVPGAPGAPPPPGSPPVRPQPGKPPVPPPNPEEEETA